MEPEAEAYRVAQRPQPGAPARARKAAGLGAWLTFLAVAAVVLAADQISKAAVRAEVPVGGRAEGLGTFDIHHVRNSGIVRGLFQGSALPLGIVTVVVVLGMLAYFARSGSSHRAMPVAFGLLVGGSIGNLADRLRLGYVTDFVSSPSGGAFNLADASILAGLAILLLALLLGRGRQPA